jgi:hypothetical protein
MLLSDADHKLLSDFLQKTSRTLALAIPLLPLARNGRASIARWRREEPPA